MEEGEIEKGGEEDRQVLDLLRLLVLLHIDHAINLHDV
jgi:hypothetical protein